MRTKLLIACALVLLLSPVAARALNCESNASGDWTNAATWTRCDGASPGLNDTVEIKVGHVVTVNDAVTAGASPVDATTYNIKVYGKLVFENPADSDNSLTAYSSIKIYSGAEMRVGTAAAPLDCDHTAVVALHTAAGVRYHILVDQGGLFEAHGCPWWPVVADDDTAIRARIESCSPDCDAGAITITLDTAVDWESVGDPINGDTEVIIGGGGGTAAVVAPVAELVVPTGYPAAAQIEVTTTNDHQVGDIVAVVSRNVAIYSDTDSQQGAIWTTSTGAQVPINLSWVRLHDMGNQTYAAVDHQQATGAAGAFDYVAATSCVEDEAASAHGVDCFRLDVATVSSFAWNIAYSTIRHNASSYDGYCFRFGGTPTASIEIENVTCVDTYRGVGAFTSTAPTNVDGGWFSSFDGVSGAGGVYGNVGDVASSLFHGVDGEGFGVTAMSLVDSPGSAAPYWYGVQRNMTSSEFRHLIYGLSLGVPNAFVKGNVFSNCTSMCAGQGSYTLCECEDYDYYGLTMPVDMTFIGNTYDACATSVGDNDYTGAVAFKAQGGRVHMFGETFGAAIANGNTNIYIEVPGYVSHGMGGALAFTCNDCVLNTVTDGPVGWDYWVLPGNYATNVTAASDWRGRAFIGAGQFLGLQNINEVANANQSFGPGGCLIEYEDAVVRDNSLNLKVTPYATHTWARVPLRRVYVDTGDVLTASVWLRKTAAFTYPPRLVLMGPGFDPTVKYVEMGAAAVNTWVQVTLSGSASAPGVVYAYLDVRGNLSGATHALEPVDPPTAVLYADGMVLSKS